MLYFLLRFGWFFGLLGIILGAIAIFFATVNVIGGYFVTDRMLAMFKKKETPKK